MDESPVKLFRCPTCGKVVSLSAGAERICRECGYEFGRAVMITPREEGQRVMEPTGRMVQRDVSTSKSTQGWASTAPKSEEGFIADPEPKSAVTPGRPQPPVEQVSLRKPTKKRAVNTASLLLHLGGWSTLLMLIAIGVKFRLGKT